MARLVNAELAATGKRKLGQQPPAHVVHRTARNFLLLHLRGERCDIVAHQIELMQVIFIRRMDGDFRRRQSEDEPAVADIDVRQLQDVPEELAVGRGIRAVDDGMRSSDHGKSLLVGRDSVEPNGITSVLRAARQSLALPARPVAADYPERATKTPSNSAAVCSTSTTFTRSLRRALRALSNSALNAFHSSEPGRWQIARIVS